jgi:hypothetical protein
MSLADRMPPSLRALRITRSVSRYLKAKKGAK